MDQDTYATAQEILDNEEMKALDYVTEGLDWRIDGRRNPAEFVAFSDIPGIAYGISLRTNTTTDPWAVRVLSPIKAERFLFQTIVEALRYCDKRENGFVDLYGAATAEPARSFG